jgi:hypothetical protein
MLKKIWEDVKKDIREKLWWLELDVTHIQGWVGTNFAFWSLTVSYTHLYTSQDIHQKHETRRFQLQDGNELHAPHYVGNQKRNYIAYTAFVSQSV